MSNLVTVKFIASPTSAPQTRYVEGDRSIQEYLEDIEGITSFKNITVEVDGAPASLSADIEDEMVISISQKKTDSGR